MSRSERAWRTRTVVALCAWALSAASPALADARPRVCLPPIFDGGKRLHPLPTPRVYWLQLLLRQHEICWGAADRVRMVLLGNSAIYGLPIDADETFSSHLNRHFDEVGIEARLHNLAFVTTYQSKDAVILHQALPYAPEVIVYPLTLSDFHHVAPILYKTDIDFFAKNRDAMQELYRDPPRGLEEPFEKYRQVDARVRHPWRRFAQLQEAGLLVRNAAHVNAEWIREKIHSPTPPYTHPTKRRTQYDCTELEEKNEISFADWQDWNILAELQHLSKERGIDVVVVNWPVAHEPVGDCYNVRYTNDELADFSSWIAAEATARGLSFVDLHDLLPPELFVDSIHVTAEGHRRIAAALQPVLDPIARTRAAARPSENNSTAEAPQTQSP